MSTNANTSNRHLNDLTWRIFAILAAFVALLFLVGTLVLLNVQRASQPRGLQLDEPKALMPFSLTNQHGQTVTSDKYTGKVTVMTFLYTSCVDTCPLTAAKLRDTYELIKDRAPDVAFVAITVDPERDTPEKLKEFSERWDMTDKWDFLVGSQSSLEPLWKEYWAGTVRREVLESKAAGEEGGAGHSQTGNYGVMHATPVHLTDKEGRVKLVYASAAMPENIAHDILLLLG